MTDFFDYFLGAHNLAFHAAGILFCLFGTLITKFHFWQTHKAPFDKFDFHFWVKDNWVSVFISLLVSFVLVRFVEVFLHWLNPKIQASFNFTIPQTNDQVFYYLVSGVLIQFWIHKKYRKRKNGQ